MKAVMAVHILVSPKLLNTSFICMVSPKLLNTSFICMVFFTMTPRAGITVHKYTARFTWRFVARFFYLRVCPG